MTPANEHLDDQLLAYHMGWLDRVQMARVDRLIASVPAVAQRSREVEDRLAPLQDWDTLPANDALERLILQRTAASADDLPIADALRLDAVPPQRGRSIRLPLTPREILAASIALILITVVVVPSWARAVSQASRRRCAENLQHIGLAMAAYRHDQDQHLPYAGEVFDVDWHLQANWLRERTPGVPRLRNSQNRFLLAAQGYLGDTARYVCPSDSQAIVMRTNDPGAFDDFAEPRNDSYNSQLPLGAGARGDAPQMVVYADSNPIFDPRASSGDGPAVSLAHAALGGQNVLRLDGVVDWATTPNVGVENDDIWRIGGRVNYSGSEIPQLATDSFMIP